MINFNMFVQTIAEGLRASPYPVSLLDCSLKNVSFLSNARIFENVSEFSQNIVKESTA